MYDPGKCDSHRRLLDVEHPRADELALPVRTAATTKKENTGDTDTERAVDKRARESETTATNWRLRIHIHPSGLDQLPPNDGRERWEPAATDAGIGTDLNGWLPSAPRSGSAYCLSTRPCFKYSVLVSWVIAGQRFDIAQEHLPARKSVMRRPYSRKPSPRPSSDRTSQLSGGPSVSQ